METQHQVHTHTFTSTNTHQQQHISAGHKHTFHSNKTPFTAQISLQVHFSPFQSFFISSSFFSSKVSHIRILNQSRQTSPGGTAAEGPWQVNGEGGVVGAPSQSPAATASWIHVVRATGPGQQSGYIYLCPLHWWTSHTTTTSQSTTALKGDAHKHSVTNTHTQTHSSFSTATRTKEPHRLPTSALHRKSHFYRTTVPLIFSHHTGQSCFSNIHKCLRAKLPFWKPVLTSLQNLHLIIGHSYFFKATDLQIHLLLLNFLPHPHSSSLLNEPFHF